jgi:hypothetical protein
MAKVYLRYDHGREITDLPPVCIKCGAPASVRKNKQFSWQPQWVPILILGGLLPYIIVSMILTKRKTVETPLCEDHKSYWWLYPAVMTLLCLGVLGLGFVGMIALSGGKNGDLGGAVCGLSVLVFFGVLVVAAIINMTRIRPTEITDRSVHLTGVSQAFADAVEDDESRRRSAFDRGDDDERRTRRPRDDDDDRYSR